VYTDTAIVYDLSLIVANSTVYYCFLRFVHTGHVTLRYVAAPQRNATRSVWTLSHYFDSIGLIGAASPQRTVFGVNEL